jgi:DNA gyrase inhibitor GyrI
MNDLPVRILDFEPMTLMCFNAFSEGPETQALDKLLQWAQEHGHSGRIFGYNNPDPSVGSPNYGYDACMQVDESTPAEGEAYIRRLEGGTYAVLHCPVKQPWDDIPAAWQSLVKWADENDYSLGQHQWLEEHLDAGSSSSGAEFELDLYMPVKSK